MQVPFSIIDQMFILYHFLVFDDKNVGIFPYLLGFGEVGGLSAPLSPVPIAPRILTGLYFSFLRRF